MLKINSEFDTEIFINLYNTLYLFRKYFFKNIIFNFL